VIKYCGATENDDMVCWTSLSCRELTPNSLVEQDTGREIDITAYNPDDSDRIVTAVTMLGIPTFPPKYLDEENQTGHLVHWRSHLRWKGRYHLAPGSAVLDTQRLADDPDPDLIET
jgi:hypothetical protein